MVTLLVTTVSRPVGPNGAPSTEVCGADLPSCSRALRHCDGDADAAAALLIDEGAGANAAVADMREEG